MRRASQKRWAIFWAVFVLALLSVGLARSANILLVAWVSYSLYDSTGTNPLADGSIVYLIGSKDNVNDGMQQVGTSYIADSVQGDDVYIGMVRIGYNAESNGTFLTADFYFDSEEVDYIYIRFFDTTNPPEGMVYWGTSPLFDANDHPFEVLFLDLVGGYATTNYDHFVIIPEPATGTLLLGSVGLLLGWRFALRRGDGGRGGWT